WHVWLNEISGRDGTERIGSPVVYLAFVPLLFPWLVYFCLGAWEAARQTFARAADDDRNRGIGLCLLLIIIPLAVCLLHKDKSDRYLLPLVGPAAILAAYGLIETWNAQGKLKPVGRILLGVQWVLLAGAGVAAPLIAAATGVRAAGAPPGEHLIRWPLAAVVALVCAAVLTAGLIAMTRRPSPRWALGCSVLVMLCVHAAYLRGYSRSTPARSGFRPLAEAIAAAHPNAQIYATGDYRKRPSVEFSIYLNRPTRWAALKDLASMPPSGVPKVAILVDRKGSGSASQFLSNGWETFRTFQRGGDRWDVLVRPAAPERAGESDR
ncbi:MAG TPA: hypothetical protein VH370_09400, partial [Humisphaera sp.]|nr:hypothetical protein [Humisphaera sp.]